MRIFLIPGLMAATMLTPAAASAAEIAPTINGAPGIVQVDLNGSAALQREGGSERRAERRANRDNRGQANIDWRTRRDRAEMRQNRRADRAERNYTPAPGPAQRTVRPDRNVNLAAERQRQAVRDQRSQRVDRNVASRQDWRRDIRRGDRNSDGRVDRRWDRNRDGQVDRRYDRNNDNRVDRRVDRNRDGRIDRRYRDQRQYSGNRDYNRYSRNWNHDWRNDRRYDWRGHRQTHRNYYRLGRYYAPYRDYRYRRLSIGISLGSAFYGSRYWINNPSYYRLPAAYPGTRWIRYYDDVLLIDTYSGEVIDVIYDFFW